jgi:hypothetical protein
MMKRKSIEDTDSVTLTTTIFGASDGLVASIALILATMTHGRRVVVAAVIGLFIAEGLGMAASQFLSDPKRNLRQAMIMGVATSITILVPAVPWTFSSGGAAVVVTCVSRARPGGWSTWLQTYGVLIGVGAIAVIAGRLT